MSLLRESFERLCSQVVPGNLIDELLLLAEAVDYLEEDPEWPALKQSLCLNFSVKPLRISQMRAAKAKVYRPSTLGTEEYASEYFEEDTSGKKW